MFQNKWIGVIRIGVLMVPAFAGIILYHVRAARKLELQGAGKLPPDPAPITVMPGAEKPQKSRGERPPYDPESDGEIGITGV